MKKFFVALCLVSCTKEAPPQQKVEPQPASIAVKPVASQPASVVVASQSAPSTSTGAALVVPEPEVNTTPLSAFLLDDEESHPNPSFARRLNAEMRSNQAAKGCEVLWVSTAFVSFACFEEGDFIDPIKSRTPGGEYVLPTTHNYMIVGEDFVPISSEDIFTDLTAAAALAQKDEYFYGYAGWVNGSLDPAAFILMEDGVLFFADHHPPGNLPKTQILFKDHPKLFRLDAEPLSILKQLQPLPEVANVQAYAQLIERRTFDEKTIPAGMTVYGTVVAGAQWMDDSGENYLFITEREAKGKKDPSLTSRYVNAYHYRVTIEYPQSMPTSAAASAPASTPSSAPVITNVRSIFTKEESCATTNRAAFVKDSILVTDYDLDGIGEASFAMTSGCGESLDSGSLTVYLVEAGGKYSVAGTLTDDDAELIQGGPFKNVSESFLKFAELRWGALFTQLTSPSSLPASAPTTLP